MKLERSIDFKEYTNPAHPLKKLELCGFWTLLGTYGEHLHPKSEVRGHPTPCQVKASKTTYDALKSHIKKYHPSKESEFKALIAQNVNHNKRRGDSDGIVSSPSSKQKMITDYRGLK
jgi:hypothetical protein